MGASFLCICPPKSIQFDQKKDNSKAEISARLSEVAAFQGQNASQVHAPGAGLVYVPSGDLSVATQGPFFAAFRGYVQQPKSLDHSQISSCLVADRVPRAGR